MSATLAAGAPLLRLSERAVLAVRLTLAMAAGALLLVALLWQAAFPDERIVADLVAGGAAVLVTVPVLTAAWHSLRHPSLHGVTDRLIAVALIAAWATGDLMTAAVLPIVMIIGHVLEERSLLGSTEAIRALGRLTQSPCRRLGAQGEELVAADRLRPGDRIRLRAGDRVPADGIVRHGTASLDLASLTGESVPVEVAPGDTALAGAIDTNGLLEVEVTRVGADSTLGRIIALMRAAERAKPPVTRLLERHAGGYMGLILLLAAAVWFASGNAQAMLAVLVASCPCALVMAAPATAVAAIAVAARHGILIKGAAFLEQLAEVTCVVFDKTGTLTMGELALVDVLAAPGAEPRALVRLAAALGAASSHPVSRAIARHAVAGIGADAAAGIGADAAAGIGADAVAGIGADAVAGIGADAGAKTRSGAVAAAGTDARADAGAEAAADPAAGPGTGAGAGAVPLAGPGAHAAAAADPFPGPGTDAGAGADPLPSPGLAAGPGSPAGRPRLTELREASGFGVTARCDGAVVALGRGEFLAGLGVAVPPPPAHDGPIAGVSRGGVFLGWLLFADRPRAESRAALAELRRMGLVRQVLLTGDRAPVAARIAAELGIGEVCAEALPEQKMARVMAEIRAGFRPLVVGDGINDSLALKVGAVGVAMGAAGTDVALASADLVLMTSDLRRLGTCLRLSRRCRRTIHVNVGIGLGWTVVLVALAAGGALGAEGAIVAALLHNLSTLLGLGNAGRLLLFDET